MWLVALGAGVLSLLTGLLPLTGANSAQSVSARVAPVLVFLIAITVLAKLGDQAKVFDVVADRTARLAGGSVRRLFVLVVGVGWLVTVLLSLDTTAVLLTPVVLALADRLGLAPAPFAYAAVWLANTGSLLLPVSNLTNLLAAGRLGLSATAYAQRMALPALVAIVTSLGVLGCWFRRDLTGRYQLPEPVAPDDRTLFRVAAAACAAVGPGFVTGLPVQDVAAARRTVRNGRVRRPAAGGAAVRFAALAPGGVEGLFLAVSGLLQLPAVSHALRTAIGAGAGIAGTLRTAGVAAVASIGLNNLPAYLALDGTVAAGHRRQLLAVLLGTNLGPLVLLFGSLATLLWRESCAARGVPVSAGQFPPRPGRGAGRSRCQRPRPGRRRRAAQLRTGTRRGRGTASWNPGVKPRSELPATDFRLTWTRRGFRVAAMTAQRQAATAPRQPDGRAGTDPRCRRRGVPVGHGRHGTAPGQALVLVVGGSCGATPLAPDLANPQLLGSQQRDLRPVGERQVLPDGGARLGGAIPPPPRNHRDPTGVDSRTPSLRPGWTTLSRSASRTVAASPGH